MRRIYRQYIKISENEKITDSIFKYRIILSVIVILSCITVMISTAFAFFRVDMEKNSEMHSAVWDIAVEESSDGRVLSAYMCDRTPEEGEWYKFILSACGTATKGYCAIKITNPDGETKKYYTAAFSNNKTVEIQAIAGCKIEFEPQWGKRSKRKLAELSGGTIIHSYTEPEAEDTLTEAEGTGRAFEIAEGEDAQAESSSNMSDEALSAEIEVPSSGEPSADNGSNTPTEGSSVTSGETSSSSEGATTGESTETTSTLPHSSSDGTSSLSDSNTPASSSLSSESSSATGGELSSASSAPSTGDSSSE